MGRRQEQGRAGEAAAADAQGTAVDAEHESAASELGQETHGTQACFQVLHAL